MEEALHLVAHYLALVLEALALLAIAIGAVEAVLGLFRVYLRPYASNVEKARRLARIRSLACRRSHLPARRRHRAHHHNPELGRDRPGRRHRRDPHVADLLPGSRHRRRARAPIQAIRRKRCKAHLTQARWAVTGAIFTLFFITLGPLKILGPFTQFTREADEAMARAIRVRAFLIAVVVGGFAGRALLEKLNVMAMLYARRIMGGATIMVLRIVGAVLGVPQVALAVEMTLRALRELGVIGG